MNIEHIAQGLLASVIFTVFGLVAFIGGFYALKAVLPFDVTKEIETDQNTALGVVIGAFILGLAYIIGSALHG